jgi:F-type H+-transporting ATPase subunit delta
MKRFAKPYAEVLLETASAEKGERALAAELDAFVASLRGSEELRQALENPAVPLSEKEKILGEIAAQSGWSELARRTLVLLARNHRLPQSDDVVDAYRELLDRREGYVLADVASAVPLSDAERMRLEAALGKATGKKIRMNLTVDPALVAGIVAKIGSTVIDASIRGEIRKMRRTLAAASGAATAS